MVGQRWNKTGEGGGGFATVALILFYPPVGENVVWSKGGPTVLFAVKPDAISQR